MSGLKEKTREVWGKVTASTQAGIDQSQAELGKLQAQAAGAPDASKIHIRAQIGEAQAKRDADEEKMRSSLLEQVVEANAQINQLEAAAAGLSGEARDKVTRDVEQMRADRDRARAKLENSLQAEIAETESEISTLEKAAAEAPNSVAARIMTRANWARAHHDTAQQWLQEIRVQAGS